MSPPRGGLALFFGLAFALAAAAFLPLQLLPRARLLPAPWIVPLVLAGRFAPSLAAAAVLAREGSGPAGLFRRLLPERGAGGAIALALLGPPAVALAATAVRLLDGTPAGPGDPARLALFAPFLAERLLLGEGIGEEPGWRGFALPRLQARMSPAAASLLLGGIEALWSLPARAGAGPAAGGGSLALLAVETAALAVLLAWLRNRTGGGLAACALAHAGVGASREAFRRALPIVWLNSPVEVPASAIYAAAAAAAILLTRGRLGLPERTAAP